MPVTARLSKQFYDRFGEAVTNELVDWMNQVDAAYKSDIREMNDLNHARFEARLEQGLARLEAKVDQRIAALDAKIDVSMANLTASIEKTLREQTRFFFGAWAVLLASIIALSFRR